MGVALGTVVGKVVGFIVGDKVGTTWKRNQLFNYVVVWELLK